MSIALVEEKLARAGYVPLRAVVKVSGLSLSFFTKKIKAEGITHKKFKKAFFPLWTELRAGIDLAEELELPATAEELMAVAAVEDGQGRGDPNGAGGADSSSGNASEETPMSPQTPPPLIPKRKSTKSAAVPKRKKRKR